MFDGGVEEVLGALPVGVTEDGATLGELLERADAALYEAKRTGGARVPAAPPT